MLYICPAHLHGTVRYRFRLLHIESPELHKSSRVMLTSRYRKKLQIYLRLQQPIGAANQAHIQSYSLN